MNRQLRVAAVRSAKQIVAKMAIGAVAEFQPGGIDYIVSVARGVSDEYYQSLVDEGLLPTLPAEIATLDRKVMTPSAAITTGETR